jgi:hypothetical protein
MRIETDLDGETREKVKEYARNEGLRLPRAYAELIESGLEHEHDD